MLDHDTSFPRINQHVKFYVSRADITLPELFFIFYMSKAKVNIRDVLFVRDIKMHEARALTHHLSETSETAIFTRGFDFLVLDESSFPDL